MTHETLTPCGARLRPVGKVSVRVRDLVEAGADGAALTSMQIKEICEVLRMQFRSVRNHFHSST